MLGQISGSFESDQLHMLLHLKSSTGVQLGGQSVKGLPGAQVIILESQNRVPHGAPCSVGSLLLPLTLSLLMLSLSLFQVH